MGYGKIKGFTLIELIVVMGILAILATIVVIAVNPARQFAASRNAKRISDVRAIQQAVNQHAADNNGIVYASITTTPKVVGTTVGSTFVDLTSVLVPNYLSSIPSDPQGGTAADTKYVVYIDAQNRVVVGGAGELGKVVSSDGEFSPYHLPNLKLWARAEAITGLSNGAAVSSWADTSNAANTLTQATGLNQPTYQTNQVGGKPAIRFDGTDDFMSLTNTINVDNSSLFVVTKMVDNGNNRGPWLGHPANNTNNYVNDADRYNVHNGIMVNNSAPTTWSYVSFSVSPTSYVVNENGVTLGTAARTTGGVSNSVGKGFGNRVFYGDIAEIIVYSSALSAADVANVELYLKNKYGL